MISRSSVVLRLSSSLLNLEKYLRRYRKTTTFVTGILATILVPLSIAYVGWLYTEAIKDKEIQAKFIEIATNILREPPKKDDYSLRMWAVQTINRYSAIKLSAATQKEMIEDIPISDPTRITLKITVADEFGRPIEGAVANLVEEMQSTFSMVAMSHTDSKGETLIFASSGSGRSKFRSKFHVGVEREGYEMYSSDVRFISPDTIIQANLRRRN